MDRRGFIGALGVASLVDCTSSEGELMVQAGATPGALPPWHMWGTTELVRVERFAGGPAEPLTSKVQLSKVNYKRPETWSFFLAATIISGSLPVNNVTLTVNFDVIFGVGRTVFQSSSASVRNAFAQFIWRIPVGTNPALQFRKWTTSILSPPLDDTAAVPADTRRPIEWLPAQDINIGTEVFGEDMVSGEFFEFEISSWVAPRSHVRPDWFEGVGFFRGNEMGGT